MSYSSEVLADSPLAYWRLGEASGTALADSSGNGRSATLDGSGTLGSASLTSDADTALALSGAGLVAGPRGDTATWVNAAAFTAELLVRVTSFTGSPVVMAHDDDGNANEFRWRVYVDQADSKLKCIMQNSVGGYVAYDSGSVLSVNTTYHVALTYDASSMQLWVNGSTAGAAFPVTLIGSRLGPLRVGGLKGASFSQLLSGVVDDFAFYGSALSGSRVAAHYAAVSGAPPAALTTTLAATAQPETAAVQSVAVSAPTSTLAATQGRDVASFTTAAAGVFPPGEGVSSLVATSQPDVLTFTARAITPVVPTPAPIGGTPAGAAGRSVVVAKAHGPATMQGTQPVYTVSQAEIPRARQQIVVDGVDISFFRDARTPDVTYTLLEPLLYGPGNLDLPQVVAYLGDQPGAGDLAWLRPQAPVEVHLVVDDVVTVRDVYKGFVAAFDLTGTTLSVELGGEANGRAAMRDRQNPIFPRINDVGHQIADAVRDLGLPHYPPLGAVTGIETMTTGGTGHLDHINDLHAKAWTRSGRQWSCMPNPATGVYETHRKDATTIHGTAFLDATRTVATLRRDISEEPNQIFVTCVTPAGMRVRFGKYPGLVQGPVPDFPGVMSLGSTGEGVRLLVGKLHASGYLKLAEVAGGFDADVDEAVRQLQDDAGLLETGTVDLATWRALYDLDVTGLSLEWANIQPAAQRSKTRKFDRSANGTIMDFNDEYDPEVIVRHRTIDLGSGVTRRQAREFARTVLHDSDAPNWVGDIKFGTGALIRGEGTIGMTVATADVMDARELRPGMNLWLPQFDGGTLVHVSACAPDGEGVVTATVDTRFRDAMEVWQVIARNKESRNDPSRHRARRYRASTIVKDSIGEWDEFGGFLGVDVPLDAGWTKFPVVAAMEGQIRKLKVVLDDPAEFVVAAWGEEPDVGWLNETIADPLTVAGTRAWEKKEDALDDRWLLYTGGTHQEPAGYWPGRKTWEAVDGEPASSGVVTGKFVDPAGFPYFAANRKIVWVTVFVRAANKISAQRVMWPQMEAGV